MRQRLTQLVCALALMVLVPSLAWAQTATITGEVRDDESGEALPGANVVIAELNTGAASGADGSYTISDVPAGSYTLEVTFVGYRDFSQEVDVSEGQTVTQNINLVPDYTGLDEVVVSGIASETSRARADVAVGRVNAEELTEGNTYQDVSQILGGKVAGVNVQPSSGNVGGGIRFNVRSGAGLNGDGQPVIYVDGVRIDNAEIEGEFGAGGQGVSALADLNPEDIASVDILKGPAGAAIYGTDGANGVVLIKTKSGAIGQNNFSASYKGTFGYNEAVGDYYSTDDYVSASDANAIFSRGPIQQHSVSARGGTEAVSYFAGVTQRNEEGHIASNFGDRTNMRANFQAFPTDNLQITANAGYTINDLRRPENDNNTRGFLGNTLLRPNSYVYLDSTAILDIEDRQRVNRFIGSLSASYNPIENLELSITAGYDGSNRRQDKSFPPNPAYGGIVGTGYRGIYTRINNQTNANADVSYGWDITPKLTSNTLVGGQILNVTRRISNQENATFPSALITDINAGDEIQEVDEEFLNERQGGIYLQEELAYDNTYFFTGVLRRDFATAVGDDAAAIFYPAIRGAVRLDQFDFVPSAFGLLKLRAGFGQNGILPELLDGQLVRYGATLSGFGPGAAIESVGDPEIVPERVTEFEIGTNLELLNRYVLDATYYRTQSTDSIVELEPAPSTGFGLNDVPRNVGGIQTQGLELALGVTPYRTRNNQVDFNFTYTYQTSEVTDLGGAPPIFGGFDLNVIRDGDSDTPGLPRSAFYPANVVIGAQIDEETGEYAGVEFAEGITGRDENDDFIREVGGRVAVGQPIPEHYGGLRVSVRLFRNLSISGLAEYALGHQAFNNTQLFASFFGNNAERNRLASQLGLADPMEGVAVLEPGTDAYVEAADAYALTDPNYDSNYIEDADYLKLREVSVRYDFSELINRSGLANVRSLSMGVSGRNLLTFTGYTNGDPEVTFDGGRGLIRGQDFLTLPSPRQILFNVSVGI